MIVLWHGRFDDKSERNSGVAMLTDRLRELKLTAEIRELNWNEWPTFEGIDLLHEANIAIGYSNGAHTARKVIQRLVDEADSNTPLAQISELTHLRWHIIFLDFVWQGLGQVFNGRRITEIQPVATALRCWRPVAIEFLDDDTFAAVPFESTTLIRSDIFHDGIAAPHLDNP